MKGKDKTAMKREQLLEEATRLFGERGFHGVGLNELLQSAHIPKGSFYSYFKSKEDFGTHVIFFQTEKTVELLSSFLGDPAQEPLEALRVFLDNIIAYFSRTGYKVGCLIGNFGAELGDSNESCRFAVSEAMQILKGQFEELLKRGQQDGSIRDDVPVSELADIFFNNWEGALLRMKVEKSSRSLEQFRDIVVGKFFPPPR